MITPENLLILADVLLLLFAVLLIPITIWVYKAKPPKELYKKYPRRVLWVSQLPFTSAWKSMVTTEDALILERYRTRLYVSAVIIMASTHLIAGYYFIHLLVQYWRCMAG